MLGCSSKKLNTALLCDPAIPLLAIDPRVLKTHVLTERGAQIFTAALSVTAKKEKQPKLPIYQLKMDKMYCIHTEHYSAIKMNEVQLFTLQHECILKTLHEVKVITKGHMFYVSLP